MKVIRDPLWNNIRLDPLALALVDTPAMQRLRYVRQLGYAFLVYPGATHSRFEHALGAHHVARRTIALLDERGELGSVDARERELTAAAMLLHDVGHYPFSHALEEIGALHHESAAKPRISDGAVAALLTREFGADAPERVLALMHGADAGPLQGLVSGSIDLDKIDYLKRDAMMCGVPYGEIDVDRLLDSVVIVVDPATGRRGVGIQEKGLSALESLLFAKYQMYRNVYWHHAVRSATAMYKRLVDDALTSGALPLDGLADWTDEGLLHALRPLSPPLLAALRERRLYKRLAQWSAAELGDEAGEWIASDRSLAVRVEDQLARELQLAPGELLLDYPAKTQMLGVDLPVMRRDGSVEHLTSAGLVGALNLPALSQQLYHSARWLRVFAVRRVAVRVLRGSGHWSPPMLQPSGPLSTMVVRSFRDGRAARVTRSLGMLVLVATLSACNSLFPPSPEERVGLLRELVRARTVSRDSLPIDGCSVNRFMDGLPTWRDSLVAQERAMIVDDATCVEMQEPQAGRFVLLRWHRNWSGEYVIEGATAPWEEGYRFTDGIFVGKAPLSDGQFYAGIKAPRAPATAADSAAAPPAALQRAGTVADSLTDSLTDSVPRDSSTPAPRTMPQPGRLSPR